MKKKIFTTVIIFFTLSLTGPAMAKGVKVPKNLCLTSISPPFSMALAISKGGKIVLGASKVPSYSIQGTMLHESATTTAPITGTGYVVDSFFQFSFSGAFPTNTEYVSIEGQIIWEVGEQGAICFYIYNSSTGIVTGGPTLTIIVNCEGP